MRMFRLLILEEPWREDSVPSCRRIGRRPVALDETRYPDPAPAVMQPGSLFYCSLGSRQFRLLGPGAKKQSGAHPLGKVIHSAISRGRRGFQDVIGNFKHQGRIFGLIAGHVVHNSLKFTMTSFVSFRAISI
jgi:hypothetical protein